MPPGTSDVQLTLAHLPPPLPVPLPVRLALALLLALSITPGTSDVQLTLAQDFAVSAAVLVTTPPDPNPHPHPHPRPHPHAHPHAHAHLHPRPHPNQVTTPQRLSFVDVVKGVEMFDKVWGMVSVRVRVRLRSSRCFA